MNQRLDMNWTSLGESQETPESSYLYPSFWIH